MATKPRVTLTIPSLIYQNVSAYATLNGFSFSYVVAQALAAQGFGATVAETKKHSGGESASPEDPLIALANQRFPNLKGLKDYRLVFQQLDAIMDAREKTGIKPVGHIGEEKHYRQLLANNGSPGRNGKLA